MREMVGRDYPGHEKDLTELTSNFLNSVRPLIDSSNPDALEVLESATREFALGCMERGAKIAVEEAEIVTGAIGVASAVKEGYDSSLREEAGMWAGRNNESSQDFLDKFFPFNEYPYAEVIKEVLRLCIVNENRNPYSDDAWAEDAENHLRVDKRLLSELLEKRGIVLTPEEDAALEEFLEKYLDLLNEEDDMKTDRELLTEQGGQND